MAQFKCIGGECEDTCCAGWSVSIDKKTYKKYTNLNTSELIELAHIICPLIEQEQSIYIILNKYG